MLSAADRFRTCADPRRWASRARKGEDAGEDAGADVRIREMEAFVKDLLIGLGLALLVVALLLFASFNWTFIYRGF